MCPSRLWTLWKYWRWLKTSWIYIRFCLKLRWRKHFEFLFSNWINWKFYLLFESNSTRWASIMVRLKALRMYMCEYICLNNVWTNLWYIWFWNFTRWWNSILLFHCTDYWYNCLPCREIWDLLKRWKWYFYSALRIWSLWLLLWSIWGCHFHT